MLLTIIISVAALILGGIGGYLVFRYVLKGKYNEMVEADNKEAEVMKEKKLLEVKEKFLNKKSELEKEVQVRNQHIQQSENRLKQREMSLNQRQEELGRRKNDLDNQQVRIDNEKKLISIKQEELEKMQLKEREKLEELSGLSAEEAKQRLVESMKDEAKTDAQSYINEIMDEAKLNANANARKIVIQTIQRVATETAIENSVSVFHIENDEVKGRIIGREGRNIRTLETLTGVDLIIDDTPETITVSCFDPIRREIAKTTLEKLIADGRIHPTRIEEMYEKAKREVEGIIKSEGERAVLDTGVRGINHELVKLLGKLHFRTSFGQNVLKHSLEVSYISGLIAAEMGEDVALAKRAGLLHDIGKALDHEMEGSHIQLGVDVAKKYKESEAVVHAIHAHHGDVEAKTVLACIVQAADAISASRPGARRENLENYIKRLERLEEIANSFNGVERSYAIQAGREIRIVVKPNIIDDDKMVLVARDVAKQIEEELDYPGQIKVHVIRESRATEYAK